MEFNPLIPIGAKIEVEKSTIENYLAKNILDDLPPIIKGEVIDYKMTDGIGIGYVLITENKQRIWIFNNELNERTKNEYKVDDTNNTENIFKKDLISRINIIDYEIGGNRTIKTMLNPINLFSWLIFTLKDIF